jgi:hypothetical protein
MPVKIKTDGGTLPAVTGGAGDPYSGSWSPTIADGNFRLKWGGTAWTFPGAVKVKDGDVGTGAWVDTGYHGYPNPPTNLRVNSWSYTNAQAAWDYAPAGGAPIDYYHIVITDAAGTWLAQENSTDNLSPNWSVSPDTKYQFYVRSHSSNGLMSGFVGPLRIQIGHDVSYNYGYVTRQRYWQSAVLSGARNKDDPFWVTVPSSIAALSGMHWRNLRTPQSSVVTPGTNRTVNLIANNGDLGPINNTWGTILSGNNGDWAFNNAGSDLIWGLVARGSGWSTTGNGTYMLWCDQFWMDGTENYSNYEVVSTNPAVGNSYW